MPESLQFVQASCLNGQAIVVEFSDGTAAVFTVEQFATLRPERAGNEAQRSVAGEPFDVRPEAFE